MTLLVAGSCIVRRGVLYTDLFFPVGGNIGTVVLQHNEWMIQITSQRAVESKRRVYDL